jgi:hypothetical protein
MTEATEISIEDSIDLILYYGPKYLMHFYFGYSEDYEVVDFYSDEQSQNQY